MPNIEQVTKKLYKHYSGFADTRTNRDFFEEAVVSSFSIRPDQLWTYGDQIPRPISKDDDSYKKIKNFGNGDKWTWKKDESTEIVILKKYENYPLTKIDDGTDNAFKLLDKNGNPIRNIIPFNYALDLYNYYLTTSDGNRIYFGVGDWQLDTFSGVLTFYDKVPTGIDHNNPPKISFFQYTGGNGFRQDTYGYDGAIIPIDNWKINKGTYTFNVNINDNKTLYETINENSSVVESNFATTYSYDGSDTNEGVALSLEKIISLEYWSTKDRVKGYDRSADAEIGTLLSDKITNFNDATITFISQNTTNGAHNLHVESNTISFDDGKTETIKIDDIIKLSNNDLDSFILLELNNELADGDYQFIVKEKPEKTYCLLLYWDKQEKEYLPFITNEEMTCNFGFAIVANNGKIPPSVALDSKFSTSFVDSITPDYYGPRNYTVTVAVESEYNSKSADYVVKNKSAYYLDDIINRIKRDFTVNDKLQFLGTIFLRAGTYELSNNLDLCEFDNIALVGENNNTIVNATDNCIIKFGNTNNGTIFIKDINLWNIDLDINSEKQNLFIRDIVSNRNIKILDNTGRVFISSCSFNNADVENIIADDSTIETYVSISNSNFSSNSIKASNTIISGITSNSISFENKCNVLVANSYFNNVLSKPKQVQFRGCRVNSFNTANIAIQDIPSVASFPIYSKENSHYLQYANFASHFTYDEDTNAISLNINDDAETGNLIWIEDKGVVKLSCRIKANQIFVDDQYTRHSNYESDLSNTGGTLQGALEDLYLTKADLVNGKVPITELPDSVAYGGLLYVGTWSFDDNDKKYPTFESTINEHPYLSLDLKVDDKKLQPGWFWVVSESSELDNDNPVSDQQSVLQYTFDENNKLKVLATILNEATVSRLESLDKWYIEDLLGKVDSDSSNSSDIDDSITDNEAVILDYLKTGGLVYTAGDWIIWNGSYFEKLDRAYQDPVFSILPVYTTGNNSDSKNGRIAWCWRISREGFNNGWGLGALDLSKKTIGEAFDQVNIELKRLQVKHPATISSLHLEPVKEYTKTSFRRINDDNTIGEGDNDIKQAYDILLDKSISRFSVRTPADVNWKNLIYFGDSGKITGYIDDDEESHFIHQNSNKVEIEYNDDTHEQLSFVKIAKPVDPYTDEFIGEGYWYGTSVTLVPKNDLNAGSHTFMVGVSDITPNNPNFMQGVIGVTPTCSIEIISPYRLENAELDTVSGRVFLVDNTIKDAEKNGYCSGIKSIKIKNSPFTFKLTYRIKCGLLGLAPVDKDKRINVYSNIDDNLKTPVYTLMDNIDGLAGFKDYFMSADSYSVQSDKVFENFKFNAIVYDVYGNNKTIENIFNCSIRFDPTTEGERLFSGSGLYPEYGPNNSAFFGSEWTSQMSELSLGSDIMRNELQKVGRNISNSAEEYAVSEYKWPDGIYRSYDNTEVDYRNITTGTEINDEVYRFATLSKFGQNDNLQPVILNSNSGFLMKFNIANDKLDYWVADDYSMSTNNIIIQAIIINESDPDNKTAITKLIDCNKPYDGFSEVGINNGDAGMYAGKSNATEKRVTFGKSTYSGRLLIRVGIKRNSGLSFESISIEDLI